MGFVRYLQHWLSGTGTPLQVTDFVPQSDPIRQWADTFPWDTLVDAIERVSPNASPKHPNGDDRRCRSASGWPWSYSSMNWAPLMRISVAGFARTLPSCMPLAYGSIASTPLRPTLCCPPPFASSVAALTRPSWTSSSPSKPLPPWMRASSARLILSLTPFHVNKALNASPMPPRCIKLKKNARPHCPHHRVVPLPPPGSANPSTRPEAEPQQSHAQLWP